MIGFVKVLYQFRRELAVEKGETRKRSGRAGPDVEQRQHTWTSLALCLGPPLGCLMRRISLLRALLARVCEIVF